MKSNQILRFGGVCGILIGVCNLVGSLFYLLLPAAQKLGSPGTVLLPSVAQGATLLILLHLGFTAIGVLGLGFVPGLTQLVHSANSEGWLRWAANLALVGYAVSAVSGLLVIDHLPRVAAAYVAGDASTQAALLPIWRGTLDPFAVWSYGAIGFWIVLASLAGLGTLRGAPAMGLSVLGVLVGLLEMLIPLGFVFKLPILFGIVDVLKAIGVTSWYVWAGAALALTGPASAPASAGRSPA